MSRQDLTEGQIFDLKLAVRALSNAQAPLIGVMKVRDYVERLTGEVLELRNREAHVRQIQNLEPDEY